MNDPKDPAPAAAQKAPQAATLKIGINSAGTTGVPDYIRATLRVLQGKEPGRVFILRAPCTILGRDAEADVALDDDRMSREHAAISCHQDGREFRVDDMKSSNGTLLNGSRVTSYALHHGDKLLVGDTVLIFEIATDRPDEKP